MYFGIDIFSGAGGLSLGAEMAGVKMLYAIEMNQSASETYRHNHDNNTKVICSDIREIDPHALIKNGEEVFIVMGGPPCQGFSLSNTRTRNMDNPNNFLFQEFVRFVKELKPKWFLFENVYGITNINQGETVAYIQKCFEELAPDLHYKVKSQVLWASDYGVPQRRNRFFMVGNRMNWDFEFPEKLEGAITVREAISDLPVLENGDSYDELPYTIDLKHASKYAKFMRKNSKQATQNFVSRNNDLVIERYKHIKQGENWRAIPEELMQNYADKGRCHSGIYKRLIFDQPSVVISNYRKSMLIHPEQHRGLSVREAARLQSFPDNFVFKGPISHMQQQIGNAVPPLLAKAVVDQIIKITEGHEQG
jgi:DNA (cytosine-5)-methyltransferase 1